MGYRKNKVTRDNNFLLPFKPWKEIGNRVHNYVAVFHKQQAMDNKELVMENIRWKMGPFKYGWSF